MPKETPPKPDELEFSLFGPGVGECVVLHLGHGDWAVVDSCLAAPQGEPVALEYLRLIGVDPSRVRLILVTHWHDDHIRGAARLLHACPSAKFACSCALRSKEFLTLVYTNAANRLVEHTSGTREFADILETLVARDRASGPKGPDFWAAEGLPIFSRQAPDELQVVALSPSSQTITDALGGIARLVPAEHFPTPGKSIRCFPCLSPNDCSVAILVKTHGLHLLLGADLEKGGDDHRGWRAVLRSSTRPAVESCSFKVAHHGSENADLEDVWEELLLETPIALLSPYARGRKPLPSPEDVARIKSRTPQLYCTCWPPGVKPRRRREVDKTMGEATRWRQAIRSKPGHLRLRAPIAGPHSLASVDMFDGATKL
jgi:beta-lactamase superfamily II metal-dependent hydrolase